MLAIFVADCQMDIFCIPTRTQVSGSHALSVLLSTQESVIHIKLIHTPERILVRINEVR